MKTIAKITRKGQVTIPKKIRELLGSDIIEFKVHRNDIIIKPVKSIGGSLHKYSKRYVPFEDIRDTVWDEVVRKNK